MKWKCLPHDQIFALMDSFSIIDAAALIAGHPPSNCRFEDYNGEEYVYLSSASDEEKATFDLARSSIRRAIEHGGLQATIKTSYRQVLYKEDFEAAWQAVADIDDRHTTIDRDDLVKWLSARGCYPEFFFPERFQQEYLNPEHQHYSPKLAAVVAAWQATSEAALNHQLEGKTVKQFGVDWLKQHAAEYGVKNNSDTDTAFKDMTTIMNWDTTGGRPSSKPIPPLNEKEGKHNELIKKRSIDSGLLVKLEDLSSRPNSQDLEDDLPF